MQGFFIPTKWGPFVLGMVLAGLLGVAQGAAQGWTFEKMVATDCADYWCPAEDYNKKGLVVVDILRGASLPGENK